MPIFSGNWQWYKICYLKMFGLNILLTGSDNSHKKATSCLLIVKSFFVIKIMIFLKIFITNTNAFFVVYLELEVITYRFHKKTQINFRLKKLLPV